MNDLTFGVEVRWSGEIRTQDRILELSAPETMGGRGVGTNPEELLVSAVSSCFGATLFGVLRRAQLPVDSLAIDATGVVTGFPGKSRFERLTVSPTILGGDRSRHAEYETAALRAHDLCLIGNALNPDVTYAVGPVGVRSDPVPRPDDAIPPSADDERRAFAQADADAEVPAWRSGE